MTNLVLMVALSDQMKMEGVTGAPDELKRRYNLALAGQWKLDELQLEERSNPMPKKKIVEPKTEVEVGQPPDPQLPTDNPQPATADAPLTIPIDRVDPNPEQPRVDFNQEEQQELADNIKANGVIQPITVERNGDRYTLHDGERRLRASRLAGLTHIPAYIVQPVPAAERRARAVVANLQRSDLNAIELASSLQEMKDADGLTDEQIAEKISKNRQWVTNKRSLLKLPPVLRAAIANGTIEERHGLRFLPLTKIKPDEMDGANLTQDHNFTDWGAPPTPNALAVRIARGGFTSDKVELVVKRILDAIEQSNQRKAEAKARAERQAGLKAKVQDLPCLKCGKKAFRLGLSDNFICNHCGQEWSTLAAYERYAAAQAEREEAALIKVADCTGRLILVEEWIANPPEEELAVRRETLRSTLTDLTRLGQDLVTLERSADLLARYDKAKRTLLVWQEQVENLLAAEAKGTEAPSAEAPAVEQPVEAQAEAAPDFVRAQTMEPQTIAPVASEPAAAAEPTAAELPVVELASTQPSSLPASPTPKPQPSTPKAPPPPPAITLPTKAETQITIHFPASTNGHQTFVALLSKPGQLLPKTYRGPITELGAVIQQAAAEALTQTPDKILAESWTQKPLLGGANGNSAGDGNSTGDGGLAGGDQTSDDQASDSQSDDQVGVLDLAVFDDEIDEELEEMES